MSEKLGLYIHIPFCEKKCRYCGFLSFADYGEDMYERYTRALCSEIEGCNSTFSSIYRPDTIFIGGGTPSLLPAEMIVRILCSVRKTFDVSGEAEITIESNPNSLTFEKLAAYRAAGINRLSMGAQSMDDSILDSLGRVHKSEDVEKAYCAARRAGFDNINIDLMFGVPEQSLGDVIDSVSKVISLGACDADLKTSAHKGPEHISLYGLQLEEDTIFYEEYKSGILDVPEEAAERAMYHEALALLRSAGYEHYEISNLCRPGFECRHNLKYWHMENYLGAGLGAHSYIGGSRSKNVDYMDEYLLLTSAGRAPVDQTRTVYDSREDAMGIFVFTALRTREGADLAEFEERFGEGFFSVYKDKADIVQQYMDDGLIKLSGSKLSLTEKGIDVSNDIMSEFVF